MRPPRNDTKLAGFMKKPTSFIIGMFESVAKRRRDGASSEAPCHAGASTHFLCEAYFTRQKNHTTLLFGFRAFGAARKSNGRHERVRHYLYTIVREPLNQSATALSGSFVPAYRFENLEIRKGFLRFPNLNLEQNPSLTTLAI